MHQKRLIIKCVPYQVLVNAVGAQVGVAGHALGDNVAVARDHGALDEWGLEFLVEDGLGQPRVECGQGAGAPVEQQLADRGVAQEAGHAAVRQPRLFPAAGAGDLVRVVLHLLQAGLTKDVKTLV